LRVQGIHAKLLLLLLLLALLVVVGLLLLLWGRRLVHWGDTSGKAGAAAAKIQQLRVFGEAANCAAVAGAVWSSCVCGT
jgi:hypothetical protein